MPLTWVLIKADIKAFCAVLIRNLNPGMCIALLLCLITFSPPALAADKVVLQLKWKHQFQFAGFYAALKEGYFAEEGIDVDIREVDMQRSATDMVLSGDAQFGIADSSLVLSRLEGRPLVVVAAIFQHSPMILITLEPSGILSPLELKNKKIMYQRNIDDAVLLAMFTETGLTDEDHTHIAHSFRDDALISGDIDAMSAYITDQPFYFKEKNIPVNILSPANYGIDFYGDMIFVEESYLRENKEQVLAFRRASLKGWLYAIGHQEEMVDWILHNLNTDKSREHLLYEAERTARLIQPELVELGYFSTNRFLRIADIYKSLGLAPINGEIEGIDYVTYYAGEDGHLRWVYSSILVLVSLSILALVLWVINQRLKREVVLRTLKFEEANYALTRYLQMLNKYVVSCSITRDGIISEVSKAYCDLSGYSSAELVGKPHSMFRHPEVPTDVYRTIWRTIKQNKVWSGELLHRTKPGYDYWVSSEIEPHRDMNGTVIGYTEVSADITDKKKIENMSMTDSLTGLANRRQLDDAFQQVSALAERYTRPLSIVIFDIDNFKTVNDTYGHLAGDKVLKSIADVLWPITRRGDIRGRWGGDEFMLILSETDIYNAQCVAETIRKAVSDIVIDGLPRQHCSFGIAQWNNSETLDRLLERADKALYLAKEKGRNRVELGLLN